MNKTIIKKIFSQNNLGKIDKIEKIKIGFTNIIYLIENKYILKICKGINNENNFEKEAYFYNLFKNKLPVPSLIVYDNSKKIYNRFFMIYPKIQGDNLYAKWHLMDNSERKKIIKELCGYIKNINDTVYGDYVKKFKIDSSLNWHNKIVTSIQNSLKKIKINKLITSEFIKKIETFVDEYNYVLTEQKIALVYWDAHFDNILVKNNKIVGILDFERTELSSLDFCLDIVKRMVERPKKYMSAETEKFGRKKDYIKLLEWYQKYYPKLFKFKSLNKRLDLYALEHDLKDLIGWPNVKEIKQVIAKTINYKRSIF